MADYQKDILPSKQRSRLQEDREIAYRLLQKDYEGSENQESHFGPKAAVVVGQVFVEDLSINGTQDIEGCPSLLSQEDYQYQTPQQRRFSTFLWINLFLSTAKGTAEDRLHRKIPQDLRR